MASLDLNELANRITGFVVYDHIFDLGCLSVQICYSALACMYIRVVLHSQYPSVQFNSVQSGIYVPGKAHLRFTPSLGKFPNVVSETLPTLLELTMGLPRPFNGVRRPLPLSTPLSSRQLMV